MDLKEIMESRRAFRSLQPADLGEELLAQLAEAARLAPSCFNNQPWRYVFVDAPRVLQELHAALAKTNAWATAGSMIIAVFSRPDLDCRIKGREYFLFDTGMATAFLILRAAELGLVAHPIAGFNEDLVKDVLCIPADMRVITLVIVGEKSPQMNPLLTEKQAATEATRPERLETARFVYRNRYEEGVGPEAAGP
ncbi:MAG: nitroreductase family protein [Spirochaetota bacterium]